MLCHPGGKTLSGSFLRVQSKEKKETETDIRGRGGGVMLFIRTQGMRGPAAASRTPGLKRVSGVFQTKSKSRI